MLVVIAVIGVLVGITLALGQQVLNTSRCDLTEATLKALLGAEHTVVHKNAGVVPCSMYSFLVEYQSLYTYRDSNGIWHIRANILTHLPPSMATSSVVPMPNGGSMLLITQINDAWGRPILFLPSIFYNPRAPCFVSAGEDGIFGTADDLHSYDP